MSVHIMARSKSQPLNNIKKTLMMPDRKSESASITATHARIVTADGMPALTHTNLSV